MAQQKILKLIALQLPYSIAFQRIFHSRLNKITVCVCVCVDKENGITVHLLSTCLILRALLATKFAVWIYNYKNCSRMSKDTFPK